MKKKKIIFIAFTIMLMAMQGFGQNSNTTYGGVMQDGGAGSPGQYVSNPSGSNNTGFGTYVFGTGSTMTGSLNSALGYEALFTNNTGIGNTAMGFEALYDNNNLTATWCSGNTGIGGYSLIYNTANGAAANWQNTMVGENSDKGIATSGCGNNNTGVGYDVLQFNYGRDNTAVGVSALGASNMTGDSNTALGAFVLAANSSGKDNVAIGMRALNKSTTVNNQVAIGAYSLYGSITGTNNTAVGFETMYFNTSGSNNVAIGNTALLANTTGTGNVAVGNTALLTNTIGGKNVAIGGGSMSSNTTGIANTGCGWRPLDNTITGNDNTATGAGSLIILSGGSGNTADGYYALSSNTVSGNTAVGDSSLFSNSTGTANVAVGYQAAVANTTGNWNTAIGYDALFKNVTGRHNTATGFDALYNSTGWYNTADGDLSLSNNIAADNTGLGQGTLYQNTTGTNNLAAGFEANPVSTTASGITAIGSQALLTNTGSFNTAVGDSALYGNVAGTDNSALGYHAGPPATIPGLVYATAIGANSQVVSNHSIILGSHVAGNPIDNVGIGMSGIAHGPLNRLEISYYGASTPGSCSTPPATTFLAGACNSTGITTGSSGLRFRDLTDASVPYPYQHNNGFLTVDDSGNVVYMAAASVGTGFGPCGSSLPKLTTDEGLNLDSNNLYFVGNNKGNKVNNVGIGPVCGSILPAKLYVFQNSGTTIPYTTPSIGELVVNSDAPGCTLFPAQPSVIGIKSLLPTSGTTQLSRKVAGWFEADNSANCCTATGTQYAIYVPYNGGNVAIGYKWNSSNTNMGYQTCPSRYIFTVNGTCYNTTNQWLSDSTLKTNVMPIAASSNPLSIINQLSGVSFNYIDSIVTDSGVAGTHYGFIAQKVARVLPNIVRTDNNGIKSLAYIEIIPWLVEGMKQQQQMLAADSIHIHNDSLRIDTLTKRFDSLYSYINSIKTCLNSLCGGDMEALLKPKNNQDDNNANNTPANTQDVALSSTNSPMLYQNIPNPFSTGTKINYYLPQGTVGAYVAFYDSYGNQIKEVQLSQTGNGTLNITPDNLTNGIYSYSLVMNGNVVDTKRMVLQK